MHKTRIGINGAGRIGRTLTRLLLQQQDMELCVINEVSDNRTIAHLLKYDSIHGPSDYEIRSKENGISVAGKFIPVTHFNDVKKLDWRIYDVDVVVECTGNYLTTDKAEIHLENGAGKIILSAPSPDPGIKTVVLGVNESILSREDLIISNASCTTNSAAPMLYVLEKHFKVESAFISTVHSYTGDQRLTDSAHPDLRRARSAPLSIIPTTTGAAKAITRVFPLLEGKIGGSGIRVPVPDGSLTEITCTLKQKCTEEELNSLFNTYSTQSMKGILEYQTDPIVSSDIIGNPNSCIFDSLLTSVVGPMVRITGWYDNETGYSNRLTDLIRLLATKYS